MAGDAAAGEEVLPGHGRTDSPIDAAIVERLARWAERDAEIGRAAQIEALETRNRKLEADVHYMMGRAATFEAEVLELRERDATSIPVRLPPVLRRARARWWRREHPT